VPDGESRSASGPQAEGEGAGAALDRSGPEESAPQQDEEPDVRFTYANERTFLAWNRTSLALIATGVAATQLLPKLQVEWGRRLLGLPLIALGAVVAAESLRQWRANQRAMRRGEPLPRSWMPLILTIGIVAVGVIAVVIAAAGTR
jgi:putative membrane protein